MPRKPKTERRPRRLLVALGAVGAIAVLPSAAGATTFCVGTTDAACSVNEGTQLQKAFNDAAALGGADTILLGGRATPYAGPFTYRPLGRNEPVTVRAVGPTRPVLTASVGETILALDQATVSGVDVVMPSSADGLGIDLTGGALVDVAVTSGDTGQGATAVSVQGAVSIDGLRVDVPGDIGLDVRGTGLVDTGGDVVARDVRIQRAAVGVFLDSSELDLSRSRVTAGTFALSVRNSGVVVSRSVLATTQPGATGVPAVDTALTLDHVTVAHEGASDGSETAVSVETNRANAPATLRSVALVGYPRALSRTTTKSFVAPFNISTSVWDSSRDAVGGAGPVTESGNAHVAPVVVDLRGDDVRPRGSSAAVDRDGAADPGSYRDLDGLSTVDGDGDGSARPDAGALEYRRRAPRIETTAVPGSGVIGAPLSFDAAASDADGDDVRLAWDFGDGTTGAGPKAQHAYATAGTFTVTLNAIDEAGVTATQAFTVTVLGATGGGEPPAPVGGGTLPTGKPPASVDRRAPVLGGVKLSASRVRAKAAGKLRLRFSLDEPATVRVVARRRTRGRTVAVGATVARRAGAGRGSIAIAKALGRPRSLRLGRLTLVVTATDAAGNRSKPRTVALTVRA